MRYLRKGGAKGDVEEHLLSADQSSLKLSPDGKQFPDSLLCLLPGFIKNCMKTELFGRINITLGVINKNRVFRVDLKFMEHRQKK